MAAFTTIRDRWNKSSTITKACIVGVPAALTAPLLIIPALSAVGFTSAGVAAGSIAASLQTATTASGSLFALCQSAGAVGAVATSTCLGVGAAAGVTTGGIATAVFRGSNSNGTVDAETQTENDEDFEDDVAVITDILPSDIN